MQEDASAEQRMPLPPASFSFLVLSMRAQAEMQLGLMHFGPEEKPEPDLALARHTIDMMGVLLEKTKGQSLARGATAARKLADRVALPFRAGFR